MRTFCVSVALSLTLLFPAPPAAAQETPVAFVGAVIHTAAGEVFDPGTLVVHRGRITAVGPMHVVPLTEGAEVRDMKGKTIIPGLVDTHSHIAARGDLNEGSGPVQPQLSAIDAIDATDVTIQLAQAGGVTTANIMPGSGNLIGGQTAYVKLRDVSSVHDMLLCSDFRTEVCGGMKMANGTNPQGSGAYPRTRMAAAAQQRAVFEKALEYRRKNPAKGAAGGGADKKGKKTKGKGGNGDAQQPPDAALVPILQILDGTRVVHFHTHRADDIITAMELGEQYGFTPVLHHVSEAWIVADEIAERQVPCSLIIIDSPGGKHEAVDIRPENGAVLESRGVKVSLHTDDPITDSRLFLRSGALAVRAGMTEEGALKALTIHGAEMLGLQDRVGSLEVGKDADFVVLSGAPFSVYTDVEQTFVDGKRVFHLADPEDRAHAVGGYKLGDRYPRMPEGGER